MRPTFTTGEAAAYVRTTAISKNIRRKSRILSAPCSAKLSAQSPPCNRKASPLHTQPSFAASSRASPANTNGGNDKSSSSTSRSFTASAYSGICATGFMRHLSGVHRPLVLYFSTLLPHANRDVFRPGRPYDHLFARAQSATTCQARPHGTQASHIKFVKSTYHRIVFYN